MECAACGGDNREGASFCRHCGAPLAEVPEIDASVAVEAVDAGLEEPHAEAEELAPDKEEAKVLPEVESAEPPPAEATSGAEEPLELPDAPESEPDEAGLDVATATAESRESPPGEPEPDLEEPGIVLDAGEDQPGIEIELPTALEGPALSTPEGPALSTPEGPALSTPEGPDEGAEGAEVELPVRWPELDELLPVRPPPIDVDEADQPLPVEIAQSLAPLEPGTLIADRYLVVEVRDGGEDETLYHARDLLSCWHCGYEANASDDSFCAQCGASLDRRPDVSLLEVMDEEAGPSSGKEVAKRLTYEGRSFLVLVEPVQEPEASVPDEQQSIRLIAGQSSDAGQLRELDEDSLLALTLSPTYESRTGPVLGLFAVADGMGGHEGGDVASKMALQVLTQEVLLAIILPELAGEPLPEDEVVDRLRQATIAANDAVYLARQKRGNDMGTTLTTALVRDDALFLAHVGDCRAYLWNAEGLAQLTADHSLVASMVASGQAVPEDIYTHPQRSIIYRCIGDQPLVDVDTDVQTLSPGDRIVVCCDGLWEMIRDDGIEDVLMQEGDPQAACELLVSRANLAGGDDNISVIVVQVEAV
jgi:serine/threonine protein phosphatase PrpC